MTELEIKIIAELVLITKGGVFLKYDEDGISDVDFESKEDRYLVDAYEKFIGPEIAEPGIYIIAFIEKSNWDRIPYKMQLLIKLEDIS